MRLSRISASPDKIAGAGVLPRAPLAVTLCVLVGGKMNLQCGRLEERTCRYFLGAFLLLAVFGLGAFYALISPTATPPTVVYSRAMSHYVAQQAPIGCDTGIRLYIGLPAV